MVLDALLETVWEPERADLGPGKIGPLSIFHVIQWECLHFLNIFVNFPMLCHVRKGAIFMVKSYFKKKLK